jgi:hypothetical protein
MFQRVRGDLFSLVLFAQATLAGFALHAHDRTLWLGSLGLAAMLNLVGWLRAIQFVRAILDTPTSRVASAAQGYVELHGHAAAHLGTGLMTPHTQLPCLWYRYRVERLVNNKWQYVDSDESSAPFDLVDASGRCSLDPAGAHIESTHKETRREGDLRHTETILMAQDTLYALGFFKTERVEVNATAERLNARRDEGELLAEWKADQAELHRRFDLDHDGAISAREWTLARLAARREIARRHQALKSEFTAQQGHQHGRHWMRQGHGGLLPSLLPNSRPYLISNLPPERLGKRYRIWSGVFLLLLLASLGGLTYVLKGA